MPIKLQAKTTKFVLRLTIAALGVGLGLLSINSKGQSANPQSPPTAPLRIGLFIGIDRYPNLGRSDLDASARDAQALCSLFKERLGFQSRLLLNHQATRQGILQQFRALRHHVEKASSSKRSVTVAIFYSGHGAQKRISKNSALHPEPDGLNEGWRPSDDNRRGDQIIIDDELTQEIHELIQLNAKVLLFSDSCHSGGMIDALPKATQSEHAGLLAYFACQSHQDANETNAKKSQRHGRFSYALKSALKSLPEGLTYEALFHRVRDMMSESWRDADQVPQFLASPGQGQALILS